MNETAFDKLSNIIKPLPTSIFGLKYFPSIEPYDNDRDECLFGWPYPESEVREISDMNYSTAVDAVKDLGDRCRMIVEIGVNRNDKKSITQALIHNKPEFCTYLGIDLDEKDYLNSHSNRVYTLKENSHNQHRIRNTLRSFEKFNIDLLMIDGWHSVNTCVNDWSYTDLLTDHGIVLMHDTNYHPGPIALYNAIDETLFNKSRVCLETNDMGMAIIRKYP